MDHGLHRLREFREQKSNGEVFEFAKFEPKNAIYQCYVSSVKGRFENARKESQFWKRLHEIDGLIAGEKRSGVGHWQVRFVQFVNPELALGVLQQPSQHSEQRDG